MKDLINRIAKEKKDEHKQLRPVDLYDFYGIASLNRKALSKEDQTIISERLLDIKDTYLGALKNRFGAWAFNGEDNDIDMIAAIESSLNDEIERQTKNVIHGFSPEGFNVMAIVGAMNQVKKPTLGAEAAKRLADNLAGFQAADYPEIAKGVLDIHKAETDRDIILAVDHMNDLQHCGGYVLVDFVAGQRDPSNALGNKVYQEILDFKRDAMSPLDFADKMSSSILAIVESQYGD